MVGELHWVRRPLWQGAFIVFGLLLWCLYLAFSWILGLPPLAQALLGTAVGLTSMASFSDSQAKRGLHRRRNSVNLAQLSLADMLALQRLLPDHEKALSWLPGPSDMELVRWINVGFEKAWPFFKEASSGLIKVKLEAVCNKYKSGSIQEISVGKIDLGKFCPYVQGIKAFPTNEGNQCSLEIQLDWRQNEDQDMLLHVSTTGPEYVVQVKDFVVYCVMQLTFTPLTQELPCFGAIVLSIIEPPLVDLQTKFISGDVKRIPGVEQAVRNVLLSALMDIWVWPGRVVLPVLPGDYSDLEASCVGHLHVQLVEGTDLANKDITRRSDPYVVLFVQRRNNLIKESTQMLDTADPVWNEQFVFTVEDREGQKLTIKLMNGDEAGLDVFVGTAQLAISQLTANVLEDLWIDLVGDPSKLHGKCAGNIHLLVEFKPKNKKGAENGSEALRVSAPPSLVQPNGSLSSTGGEDQFVVNYASGHTALNDGLRIILEKNGSVRVDNHSRVVTPTVASLIDSPIVGTQGLMADMPAQPLELAGEDENFTSLKEKAWTGCYIDDSNASEDGVVVAEIPRSFESERQSCPFSAVEEKCSQEGVGTQEIYFGGSSFSTSIETSRKACISENDTCDENIDMSKVTVDQPYLLVAGDPAWGLNGLPLEHCSTSAIHEDMFSSEIFEVD